MLRRLATALSVAVATSLVVAACTPTTPPTSVPSSSASSSQTPTEAPAEYAPDWPAAADLDPSGLKGLKTYTAGDNDAELHIVVPQLAGHKAFNSAMKKWADQQAKQFKDDYGPANPNAIATPSLHATWQAVALSKDVVGFEINSILSPGVSVAQTRHIAWYSPVAGAMLPATELISPTKLDGVIKATIDKLRESKVDIDAKEVKKSFHDGRASVAFTDKGDLYIAFDSYQVAAGAAGAPAVALKNPTKHKWLSEFGKKARRATLDPTPAKLPRNPQAPPPATTDCTKLKCVALTFDDGPSASTTPRLLKILANEHVRVTFFTLGSQAKAFPQIVAEEVRDGHEVASHTWSHADLATSSKETVEKEINDTNKVLTDIVGTPPTLLRPPYGATNDTVSKIARNAGMAEILWDIDTLDWQHHDPKKTLKYAEGARGGSIILMHDIHSTTIDAVPSVISALRKRGFTFVTVSDLLDNPQPGKSYFNGN